MSQSDFDGFKVFPGFLTREKQEELVATISKLVMQSPLYTPVMPKTGKPLSVRMTSLGVLGWVSDKSGYRYQEKHPITGGKWPLMPAVLNQIWRDVAGYTKNPQSCMVNYYGADAKMGLHRDNDEKDFDAPIVSISLGDTGVFRIGGPERKGPTKTLKLSSGDVIVMGGQSRHFYHGIDRVLSGSSTLLKNGGRLNLTLRRVTI